MGCSKSVGMHHKSVMSHGALIVIRYLLMMFNLTMCGESEISAVSVSHFSIHICNVVLTVYTYCSSEPMTDFYITVHVG